MEVEDALIVDPPLDERPLWTVQRNVLHPAPRQTERRVADETHTSYSSDSSRFFALFSVRLVSDARSPSRDPAEISGQMAPTAPGKRLYVGGRRGIFQAYLSKYAFPDPSVRGTALRLGDP